MALPALDGPRRCRARIRYRMQEAPATVEPAPEHGEDAVRVRFDEPQRAITPGQAVVFYDGDVVLGGATIASVSAAPSEAPLPGARRREAAPAAVASAS